MPREKDPFRNYVSFLHNNKWRCSFCRHEFNGSATRIKAHLAGLSGFGVIGCEKVRSDVGVEAREFFMTGRARHSSVQGVSEERIEGNVRAALTSTSDRPNVEEGTTLQFAEGMPECAPAWASLFQYDRTTVLHSNEPAPSCNEDRVTETSSSSLQESMDLRPITATLVCPSSSQDVNKGAPVASHPNKGNNFEENGASKRNLEELCGRVTVIRDELEFASSLSEKKQRREVENWLPDSKKFIKDYAGAASKGCLPPNEVTKPKREAKDLLRRGQFPKGSFEARETKVSKFLEGKMVGEAFKSNTAKILEYLVGNQVSRLGIYGMGGVGKTTIMEHIRNRLLEKANYGNVLWITVSKDFNTHKLQDDIWKALGLCTLQETDVRTRAAMLHHRLTERGKCTLFLDDVWEHFDLEEVGILVGADGIKLVLTTRSFDVCRQMHCQETIKIEPLSQKEAESLFLEELGSEVAVSLEIKTFVKSIVEECAGLPLGVITIARSMRGVTQLFRWKDFLMKLKESNMRQTDMEKKALMKLKFSYDRLDNHEVQQCFLSCALYPGGKLIDKFELIELFIDQELICGLNTREEQYDRGLSILNELENVCLLEVHGSKIKMHNLIRGMALLIMHATSLVKAGKGLRGIPSENYWMDALEKVSLMENDIREFPLSMSPNCPELSICLLNRSLSKDVVIPESFFKHLWGLKVLNLSGCKLRELPYAISDLVNLRALLLSECRELLHIPFLGKLKSLRKLDLCGCVNLEALEGLGMLVCLRYLDLTYTSIERLPRGTLGGLRNLQYLKVQVVNIEDITKLGALETFECCFEDVDDFNRFVRDIKRSINPCCYELKADQEESKFCVKVGADARFGNCERRVDIRRCSHAIVSVGEESTGSCILIPHDMLIWSGEEEITGPRILIPQDVQTLSGKECNGIENLSCMSLFKNLESLNLDLWRDLWVLFGLRYKETTCNYFPSPNPSPQIFPSLRVLKISRCPKLMYLFGHARNFHLPYLQVIQISHCEEMVGITAALVSPLAFPSLTKIEVSGCNKMKRVVESEWLPHCPSLKCIIVRGCENVEEIMAGPPPFMTVKVICLESLVVQFCNNMRRLFPHEWLNHLQNLQSIDVNCCKGMVEMIGGGGQGQEGSMMTPVKKTPSSFQSSISLPKLERLYLQDLPQLKSICEVPITYDSLKDLKVHMCPKLKGIPLQFCLCDNLPYIEAEDKEKLKTWI